MHSVQNRKIVSKLLHQAEIALICAQITYFWGFFQLKAFLLKNDFWKRQKLQDAAPWVWISSDSTDHAPLLYTGQVLAPMGRHSIARGSCEFCSQLCYFMNDLGHITTLFYASNSQSAYSGASEAMGEKNLEHDYSYTSKDFPTPGSSPWASDTSVMAALGCRSNSSQQKRGVGSDPACSNRFINITSWISQGSLEVGKIRAWRTIATFETSLECCLLHLLASWCPGVMQPPTKWRQPAFPCTHLASTGFSTDFCTKSGLVHQVQRLQSTEKSPWLSVRVVMLLPHSYSLHLLGCRSQVPRLWHWPV